MHVRLELEISNFAILANAIKMCRIKISRLNGHRESGFLKPPFSNRFSEEIYIQGGPKVSVQTFGLIVRSPMTQ